MAGGMKGGANNYTTQAILSVTESAANTLTFDKLETGLSVYDKIGWIIARVEWKLSSGTYALFNGTGDTLTMALSMSNNLTSLAQTDPALITQRNFVRLDFGTAANASIFENIYVDDFSGLPGGGLLILPNPLYIALLGSGLTAAANVTARIFFQPITMTGDDFTNLVQARQLLIST